MGINEIWGGLDMWVRLLILAIAVSVSGCATIIRGTEQQVSVNTNPTGAQIQFSNGISCIAPCNLKAKRDQSLVITISKDECQTQTASMIPMLAGAGVIFGGLIDYGTGAVYDLQPNPLTVTLSCQPITSRFSPAPTPETAAVAPAVPAYTPPAVAYVPPPAPARAPPAAARPASDGSDFEVHTFEE